MSQMRIPTLFLSILIIVLPFSFLVAQEEEEEEFDFQREPGLYAGIETGVTFSKLQGVPEGEFDNQRSRPGIMLLAKVTYVVNNFFMASLETGWNQQGLQGDANDEGTTITSYRLDYWETNLLAEFGLPSEKIIPYFFIGPSYAALGNAQAISQSSVIDAPGSSANAAKNVQTIRQNLQLYDFGLITGIGIRANFWENIMIHFSGRYRDGLLDIGGSQFVEPVSNRSFSFSLGAVYRLPFTIGHAKPKTHRTGTPTDTE